MNLYELSQEGMEIADILIASQGELDEATEQRLDALLATGPHILEAAARVVRSLEADTVACAEEAERLKKRAESFSNQAERLKERMTFALDCAFGGKVKTPLFTIWAQNSPPTVAFDLEESVSIDNVPPDFLRVRKDLNRVALKESWERGEKLPDGVVALESAGKRYCRIK